LILAAGIVSLWTGLPVSAQSARDTPENQLDFSISLGAGYQDNVFHSATDQQGELVGIAGARIAYQEHRPKLEADVRGNCDYRRYSSGSFGGELYSGFNDDVLLLLVPDVFEWKLGDDLAQVYSQDGGPDTPDDR